MSLASTPAQGSKIAANALRNAGLIDRDSQMRDVSDNPGGKKGKVRSGRIRFGEMRLDRPITRTHTTRSTANSHAGPSDPLAIRGAARSLVPTAGRIRRNAVSSPATTLSSGIPVRSPKPKGVESWREFVKKRYNPETRYLNLDSMIDDEIVKKYNLTPPGSGASAREAAVIFKLASQLKPEVQTLSLANNNLTGPVIMTLSRHLPNLVNLSLQNNNIRDKKDIAYISPKKDRMLKLQELILLGNPIRENAYKAGAGETYRRELAQRFSALAVLDQEPIAQISFDAPAPSAPAQPVEKPSATTFPCEIGSSFVTGVDGALVSNFLIRFFGLHDTQQEALINVYDPAATFSFSANTSIPIRARIEGFHSSREMPNQRKLEWKGWLEAGSRNLSRIAADPVKTVSNLHIGAENIVKAIRTLPKTKHDISGPPEKFCLDSYPVPHGQSMGLLMMIHGQFTEVANGGIRSFDRTFMLIPAPEGSRARFNGWDVVILSDQLTIRGYSSHEAWKAGPILVQAQPNAKPAPNQFTMSSLPPDQQAALATMSEQQRNLVLEVCARTNLNVKFAVDCLQSNNWVLEPAIANFNAVKGSLSREAFL